MFWSKLALFNTLSTLSNCISILHTSLRISVLLQLIFDHISVTLVRYSTQSSECLCLHLDTQNINTGVKLFPKSKSPCPLHLTLMAIEQIKVTLGFKKNLKPYSLDLCHAVNLTVNPNIHALQNSRFSAWLIWSVWKFKWLPFSPRCVLLRSILS